MHSPGTQSSGLGAGSRAATRGGFSWRGAVTGSPPSSLPILSWESHCSHRDICSPRHQGAPLGTPDPCRAPRTPSCTALLRASCLSGAAGSSPGCCFSPQSSQDTFLQQHQPHLLFLQQRPRRASARQGEVREQPGQKNFKNKIKNRTQREQKGWGEKNQERQAGRAPPGSCWKAAIGAFSQLGLWGKNGWSLAPLPKQMVI